MIRYRKPRAHIGSNDPEQLKRWAKEFPNCNWGIEIDRSCIAVVDLTHGRRPPTAHGLKSIIVTATVGGTHHFYLNHDRDPITDEPEIITAKVGPASADGDGLVAFLKGEILPHAKSEESHLYPVADSLLRQFARPTATMTVDHE